MNNIYKSQQFHEKQHIQITIYSLHLDVVGDIPQEIKDGTVCLVTNNCH